MRIDRRPSPPHDRAPTPRERRPGEEGVALILAIVITLLVALIVAGIAQVTVADFEMSRLTRWDTTALYLAQAGIEHQLYVLKGNKDGAGIAYTNYPVTADQRFWYMTTLTCLLNCASNTAARRWRIQSIGEIRQYDGVTYTVLQTRTITVEANITYDGTAPVYGYPLKVTLQRWEEAVP